MIFLRPNGERYETYGVPTGRTLNRAFSQADGLG